MKGFGQAMGGRRNRSSTAVSDEELLAGYVEVIKGELWWTDAPGPKQDTESIRYFSVDDELVYKPIFQDFGPVNIGMIHRYCTIVAEKLKAAESNDFRLVHYCSSDPAKRANAILLAASFQVVVNNTTAREAWQPFEDLEVPPLGFVDALDPPSEFQLTIMDCLRGLQRAVDLEWYDFRSWGPKTYDWLARYSHGDMTWIVPKKLLAFPDPTLDPETKHGFVPENYAPLFHSMGISLVVRVTTPCYDADRFRNLDISHQECEFEDGSCPLGEHIDKFLQIVEAEEDGVAVHCKAGLGRTGTLIGLYCMKHFGFSALGFMGWCRLCRPGSILGPQQQFLVAMEKRMHDLGASSRSLSRKASVSGHIPMSPKSPMSPISPSSRRASKHSSLRNRMPSMVMQDETLREVLGRSQGSKLREAKRRASGEPNQLTAAAIVSKKPATSCMGCFTGLWHKLSSSKARDEATAEGLESPTPEADSALLTPLRVESRAGSKTVSFSREQSAPLAEEDDAEAAAKMAAEEVEEKEATAKAAVEAAAQAAAAEEKAAVEAAVKKVAEAKAAAEAAEAAAKAAAEEKAAAEAAAKKAAEDKAAAEAAEVAKKKAAEEEAAAAKAAAEAAEAAAKAAAEEKAAAEAAAKKAAEEQAAAEAAEAAKKKAAEEEAAAAKAAAEAAAKAAAEEKAAAEAAAKKVAEEKAAAEAAEAAKKKAAEEEAAAAEAAAEAAAKAAAEEKVAAEAAAKKVAEEKAAAEAAEAAEKKAAEEAAAAKSAAEASAAATAEEKTQTKAAAKKGSRRGKAQKKSSSPSSSPVAGA